MRRPNFETVPVSEDEESGSPSGHLRTRDQFGGMSLSACIVDYDAALIARQQALDGDNEHGRR